MYIILLNYKRKFYIKKNLALVRKEYHFFFKIFATTGIAARVIGILRGTVLL